MLAGGPQAEEIRRIRTNLQMIGRVGVPKAFVFSSALAGEGKSYTSIRVAASFAAAGDRVLLIDADLRRPTVAGQLLIEDAVGLTEILVGRADVRRGRRSRSAPGSWCSPRARSRRTPASC